MGILMVKLLSFYENGKIWRKNLSNNRVFETFYVNGNRFGMEMLAPKTKMGSHFLASVLYRVVFEKIFVFGFCPVSCPATSRTCPVDTTTQEWSGEFENVMNAISWTRR